MPREVDEPQPRRSFWERATARDPPFAFELWAYRFVILVCLAHFAQVLGVPVDDVVAAWWP